jgi:hypothetical protein
MIETNIVTKNGAPVRQRLLSTIGFPVSVAPRRPGGMLRRALFAAVLAAGLAGVLSASAAAATCTDNFTGPNEGQWTQASNWSAGLPGPTTVACWPSDITVLINEDVDAFGADPASFQGGGLTIFGEDGGLYFENATGVSTLSGTLTQKELGYMRGPQTLEVSGPIKWSSGQEEHINLRQGPGTSLAIEPGLYPDMDPGSTISTESPIMLENATFEFGGASSFVTTTSTINLAPGLELYTGGGDGGTFTAEGIGPNSGPKYGLGGDSLTLTGGTTTVASGNTLESGPLKIEGGSLQDDGTVGQFTFSGTTTPSPITLAGGTLSGTGTVAGPLTNSGGTVAPGDAPGHLTVAGNYTQEAGGTLAVGIAGPTPGSEFDQLLVGGSATLAGALSVTDENGYEPPLGQSFKIISGASSRTGSFATVGGPSAGVYGLVYEPDGATLTTTVAPSPKGGSTSSTITSTTSSSSSTTTTTASTTSGVASTAKAIEELRLGCTNTQLVLNDVYIQGSRVEVRGSAAKSYVGKKVKILFNEGKSVATATVEANGQFTTTAPLPPAKVRDNLDTRYTAEFGKLRSVHLKLVRRLLLEPLKASGTTVTLTGQLTPPLTKPIAPVTVEQQLECGKTTIVKTFTPSASGRFDITLTVPSNAKAAIFRLTSKVAANKHSITHGFTTFSLPLPVAIG